MITLQVLLFLIIYIPDGLQNVIFMGVGRPDF